MAITITEEFIAEHLGTLNASQAKILGLPWAEWIDHIRSQVLSNASAELFIELKGAQSSQEQERIIAQFKARRTHTPSSSPIETLRIYCDGACTGNPGPSGSGVAIYEREDHPILLYGGADTHGTNNTAELKALIHALEYAKSSSAKTITIFSDSLYSIDCVATWAYGWKQKGWRKKKGGEIKNLDLIQHAHALYETLKSKLTLTHVKGHAGIEGNELADRMALRAIAMGNSSFQPYTYESIAEVLKSTSDARK